MKLLSLFVLLMPVLAECSKLVCYYTNWPQYRPDPKKYFPEDVDPNLCTHVIYSFATMDGNQLAPYEWNDETMYGRMNNLRSANPDLQILLAVGGWNFGVDKMSAMLATPENRAEFVSTSITYLRTHNFDGLDLDFEYPGATRDDFSPPQVSPPEDKQRFTALVQELRAAFDAETPPAGKAKLLLTAAVACGINHVINGYEINLLAPELDWIGLMSYDFNGAWDPVTGHNSPLYADRDPTADPFYQDRSIDYCVRYWHDNGTPKNKLVVGLATYGRSVALADPNENALYSNVAEAGTAGTYTKTAGFLASYEACATIITGGTTFYDPLYETPYAYNGDQWVSYDNERSINTKMSYVLDNGYDSVMTWSLDLDDFNTAGESCGRGVYPLINIMKCRLAGGTYEFCGGIETTTAAPTTTTTTTAAPTTTTTTTAAPTTTTTTTAAPTTTTTTEPPGEFSCVGRPNGIYKHPTDCTKFKTCSNEVETETTCSQGLYFNPDIGNCDWASNLSDERREECGL